MTDSLLGETLIFQMRPIYPGSLVAFNIYGVSAKHRTTIHKGFRHKLLYPWKQMQKLEVQDSVQTEYIKQYTLKTMTTSLWPW